MGKNRKQILPTDKIKENKISLKFNIIIDKNNNPVIWIDDVVHFMTQTQFNAFLQQSIKIAVIMNPEIDYSKYL